MHWQDLCPACKRKTLSHAAQLKSAAGGCQWLNRPQRWNSFAEQFGPHLNYTPAGRLERGIARTMPDRLVKTHCCFCGQQCGIQLKVRENHVIGFEPWEDFPFNRGMLCPKGVKRYLQVESSGPAARSADAHRQRLREGDVGTKRWTSRRAVCARSRTSTARMR